jgi:hypothetical protein
MGMNLLSIGAGQRGGRLTGDGTALSATGDWVREAAQSLAGDGRIASLQDALSFALERARDLARDIRAMRDCVPAAEIPGPVPPRKRQERLPVASVQAEFTRRIDGAFDQYLSQLAREDWLPAADLDLDLLLCILFARDAEPAKGSRQLHDLLWGPGLNEIVEGWLPRSVVPEVLRRRARDGRAKVDELPCESSVVYIRRRMAVVAGQVADLVSGIIDRQAVDSLLASRLRLRALAVASCACWLDGGREVAQRYVDIAAGITAMERRSASSVPPGEVIVLVRATRKQPSRPSPSRRWR